MLPRQCLTMYEVPYLCAIVCPLNARLDLMASERANDIVIDEEEPLAVIFAEKVEQQRTI